MAVSIEQRIQQLRQIRLKIAANREKEVNEITANVLVLVKRRIQTKGENAEGNQFEAYTTPYAKKRRKPTSRGGLGVQSEFVDFTVTGRMMASVQPRTETNSESKTTVIVRAGDNREQTKLNGQFRKRGNILAPSQSEIDLIRRLNFERVRRKFDNL